MIVILKRASTTISIIYNVDAIIIYHVSNVGGDMIPYAFFVVPINVNKQMEKIN